MKVLITRYTSRVSAGCLGVFVLFLVIAGAFPGCKGEPASTDSQVVVSERPAGASNSAGSSAESPVETPERLGAGRHNLQIAMADGVKLATDVYLPGGEEPVSTVLARTPYGREDGAGFGALFTSQGIAFVIQGTRGRDGSEGTDMVFGDDGWGAHQDGFDTVEWIKAQPWSNGVVGTFGMSALGIASQLLAPLCPDLACQVIWVAPSKFYGQLSYQGGVWRKNLCEKWIEQQGSSHVIEEWKGHPADDAFWSFYDLEERAGDINAPGLHVGGWWDIFAQGTIDSFISRQTKGGDRARGNQMLIMGPWGHAPSQDFGDVKLPDNFMGVDLNGVSLRFLKHWLSGDQAKPMSEPTVQYYTLGDFSEPEAPGNEWRTAPGWPPFETRDEALFLHADGSLATTSPANGEDTLEYAFDPGDPCPTHGGQNLILPAGPFDQSSVANRSDVLRFVTAPLEAPMEVTGRVRLRLFVSSDAPDTDFTAKLVDVYPDGREILLLDNIQRVKFRNGYEQPEPLPPGEVGELTVDLWSISIVFNKGHRIGLHVSSSNYPRFEVNPNTGADFPPEDASALRIAHNTVYVNTGYASALILPVPVTAVP